MSSIRIAHLSDPHLPAPPPSVSESLGKRGLSGLSWRLRRWRQHSQEVVDRLTKDMLSHRLDLIAITGDLVNFGLRREFEQAQSWLERLGVPEQVLVIPGNHDAMQSGWESAFDQHLGAYGRRAPTRIDHSRISLVTVSTALPTAPFMASGRISSTDLHCFRILLGQARTEEQLPIVLMHHPPTDLCVWRKALHGRDAVLETLREVPPALVLHGHTHKRELSIIPSGALPIPVLGAPSFSMAPDIGRAAGAWRLIEITTDTDPATAVITERAITDDGYVIARTPVVLSLAAPEGCPDPSNR